MFRRHIKTENKNNIQQRSRSRSRSATSIVSVLASSSCNSNRISSIWTTSSSKINHHHRRRATRTRSGPAYISHIENMRRMDNNPPTRQYVVQSGAQPAQYISSTQQQQSQQQRPQNVKYVQSSQPPQKQYVQGSGIAYREVPNNNNETVQVISSNPPITNVQQQQPTLITRRTINSRTTDASTVDVQQPAKVEGQMMVNGILAGFLILSFHPSKPVSNTAEARVLSLQLVAFGCFLSAFSFYVMYLQRGRRSSMRSWVYCGQLLSMVGLVLLMSSVAVASRVQFGGEFGGVWVGSVSVVIILVGLPILCDIGFCFSRLVMLMLDWFDNLFK